MHTNIYIHIYTCTFIHIHIYRVNPNLNPRAFNKNESLSCPSLGTRTTRLAGWPTRPALRSPCHLSICQSTGILASWAPPSWCIGASPVLRILTFLIRRYADDETGWPAHAPGAHVSLSCFCMSIYSHIGIAE